MGNPHHTIAILRCLMGDFISLDRREIAFFYVMRMQFFY
jgi:hypothetical protein